MEALKAAEKAVAAATTDAELLEVARLIRSEANAMKAAGWDPYPWQHPHAHPPGWKSLRAPGVCDERCYELPTLEVPAQGTWLEYGGRGTGKTEGAAHYVNRHVSGPACDPRIRGGHKLLIIGPTQGDAVDACVEGVSGLKVINPAVRLVTHRGGTFVTWPSGARARILGASTPEDVERTRASGNNCLIWLEEAAAMRRLEEVRSVSAPGLRTGMETGARPHYIASTTPKNRPEMQALSSASDTIVTKGRTRDAHRLPTDIRVALEARFGNTTLGRQELDAEELGDVEGALWVAQRPDTVDGEPNKDERPGVGNDRVEIADYGWISHRADSPPPTARNLMHRVVIAVDPPGGRTECGIIPCGSIGHHGYTLADLSIAGPPDTWAKVVLNAYLDFGAEGIAAEHTYGGDMVADVITTRVELMRAAGEWPAGLGAPPIFKVPTKVNKRLRAEPIQGLSQQHRIHNVGILPGLESEQTGWVMGESESPNRLDAYVHGHTFLLVRTTAATSSTPVGRVPTPGRGVR